jgi:hypothetical protein
MRQYSLNQTELTWFGLDLKPGLATGQSIVEARTSQSWSMKPTGTGRIVRTFNPDHSGTLTLTVDRESGVHQDLIVLQQTDEATQNVVGVAILKDLLGGQINYYKNAYLQSQPDETYGTEGATVTWVLAFESVERVAVTPNANQVGS